MEIKQITRPHDFINVSADFILKICRSQGGVPSGVRGRGKNSKKSRINIALSGGSTPKEIYESLAKKLSFMLRPDTERSIPNQLHFYQVDERYVPPTHKDSNQKMITAAFAAFAAFATLLNSPAAPNIHFHFFDTSLPLEKSLTKYSKELPKSFDLTILGIGPDGHTASLFPANKGTANFKALTSKASVAHTTTENFAIKDRLTLTFATILKSKNLLVLLKNKPEIITELKTPTKSPKEFPAHKLNSHKKLQIYFTP